MLESAEVLNTATGDVATFAHNDWLPYKADAATEIPATGGKQVFQDYTVVVTGAWGACCYDAALVITGTGPNGDAEVSSREIRLPVAEGAVQDSSSTFKVRWLGAWSTVEGGAATHREQTGNELQSAMCKLAQTARYGLPSFLT